MADDHEHENENDIGVKITDNTNHDEKRGDDEDGEGEEEKDDSLLKKASIALEGKTERTESKSHNTSQIVPSSIQDSNDEHTKTTNSVSTKTSREHNNIFDIVAKPPPNEDLSAFGDRKIDHMSANMVAAIVEDGFISMEGTKRAMAWKPKSNDVICAAPKSCGQGVILTIIHLLATQGQDVSEEGSRAKERLYDSVPWIESRKLDSGQVGESVRGLHLPQEGRSVRIFKTHMSAKSVTDRIDKHPKSRWITVLRHPYDQRLAWFKHLEETYKREKRNDPDAIPFSERFSAEDFALVPTTACRISDDTSDQIYEDDVLNWTKLRNRENVLVLCHEESVYNPKKTIDRIATFLKVPCDDALKEKIIKHLDPERMLASYHLYHSFHPESGKVGEGKKAFSRKTCLKLDDLFFDRLETELSIQNYEELYALLTGDPYPFSNQDILDEAKQQWLNEQRRNLTCCEKLKTSFGIIREEVLTEIKGGN